MTSRNRLRIGGDLRDSGRTDTIRSPWNEEVVGEVSLGGPSDMDDALAAAVEAFEIMRRLPAERRGRSGAAAHHPHRLHPGMRVCRDEVFGPVTMVEPFERFEDAIHVRGLGLRARRRTLSPWTKNAYRSAG